MLFRRIVFYALLVGVVSGLLLTAVQMWQVVPIIKSAEVFEGPPATVPAGHEDHQHAHGGHEHDANAWAPADGLERTAFTALSNVLIAIGLALVLLSAIVTSVRAKGDRKLDWRHGLLWGGAGYAVFFLAPAMGLPPEVPGTAAASLEGRQLWWLFVVLCTAAGLAGFAFGKSPWRWLALGLLVVPHLAGAPHPPGSLFPDQTPEAAAELTRLTKQFFGATAIANAALWLALGLISVWAAKRIVSLPEPSSD